MGVVNEKVDVVCPACAATFSAFLKQMATHNQKIVCPKCGQVQDCSPTDARTSQSTRKP
jgi:predicted Zn finger-like uncharacterized protein